MRMTSQDYAALANDAYRDRPVGVREPGQEERIRLEGVDYRILEHVNNRRNGYQGTIYQRVDDGEIVVAHRGTEQIWKDGVVTDGSMVLQRVNPQAEDAVALTERAKFYANRDAARTGTTPEVTVTGHSLGGTLAQVTAHHFDLRGETFNAYGAASLDRRIPEGGSRVLNHVMAADTVSAASPHYGQVRIYATLREISTLQATGYHNNRLLDAVTPDNPLAAAGASLGSHSMHHFLPVDGDGRPDRSVLANPEALRLAEANRRMIEGYRDDVQDIRRGVTVISRGPVGLVRDGIDQLRGALPAGEPAAREERERLQRESRESGRETGAAALPYYRADGWRQAVHERDEPARIPPLLERPSPRVGVERLLAAAQANDPAGLRTATQDLQASPYGQSWRELMESHRERLAGQAQATEGVQQAEQRQQSALGAAR